MFLPLLLATSLTAQGPAEGPIQLIGAWNTAQIESTAEMTVFTLATAAGWNKDADLSRVVLTRFGGGTFLVVTVDLRHMILTGDMRRNVRLNADDILWLPRKEEATGEDPVDAALQALAAGCEVDARHRALIVGHRMRHSTKLEAQVQSAMQLGQMGKEAVLAVPDLEKALALDVRVAREAVTALGMIGAPARQAVPALRELAPAKDLQLRVRAAAALRQIEAEVKEAPPADSKHEQKAPPSARPIR